jgi:hypothetical protein
LAGLNRSFFEVLATSPQQNYSEALSVARVFDALPAYTPKEKAKE